VSEFYAVAQWARNGKSEKTRRLYQEVLRDLPAAYVEVGHPVKAWRFFSRLAGDEKETFNALESLARLYAHRRDFGGARLIYRVLAKRGPKAYLAVLGYRLKAVDAGMKTQVPLPTDFEGMLVALDAVHQHLGPNAAGVAPVVDQVERITLKILGEPGADTSPKAQARAAEVCARWARSVLSGPVADRCRSRGD
jgi:hypothetical protein